VVHALDAGIFRRGYVCGASRLQATKVKQGSTCTAVSPGIFNAAGKVPLPALRRGWRSVCSAWEFFWLLVLSLT